jgi:hypothetical protein
MGNNTECKSSSRWKGCHQNIHRRQPTGPDLKQLNNAAQDWWGEKDLIE